MADQSPLAGELEDHGPDAPGTLSTGGTPVPQHGRDAHATAEAVTAAGQAIIQHDLDVKALLAHRQEELETLTPLPDPRPAAEHRAETNELAVSAINRRIELARAYHVAREKAGI